MNRTWRGVVAALAVGMAFIVGGCGGGSSNDNSNSGNSGGTGGTSGGTTGTSTGGTAGNMTTSKMCGAVAPSGTLNSGSFAAPAVANVVPLAVDAGTTCVKTVNLPYVTVTLCAPGSTTVCQTIDHILLDTGSTGLRVLAPVLSPSLGLTPVAGSGNTLVGECFQFVDGSAWGPIRRADVHMGGELLPSLPIQVIGDISYASVPSDCPGPSENTVTDFGANGLLGVGTSLSDCGTSCAGSVAENQLYYQCSGNSCIKIAMPVAQQVPNPVAQLSTDNNGVIVQLPAISDAGATSVAGSLVLGINTQSNNRLSGQTKLTVSNSGVLTTIYKNRTNTTSFFDSGSNFFFFNDSTLAQCTGTLGASGFYCPSSLTALSATAVGRNSATATVNFNLANASQVVKSSLSAYNNIGAAQADGYFDLGLPFFYGRSVFSSFQGTSIDGVAGPWIAF